MKYKTNNKKNILSTYFYMYYNIKFSKENKSRLISLLVMGLMIAFSLINTLNMNLEFINIAFALGFIGLIRHLNVLKLFKFQCKEGNKLKEIKKRFNDESINNKINLFINQGVKDSLLMIILMYASIYEVFIAKTLILKIIAFVTFIIALIFNYDTQCYDREKEILSKNIVIDIIAFIIIGITGLIFGNIINITKVHDVGTLIMSIVFILVGIVLRNNNTSNIFTTKDLDGFVEASKNLEVVEKANPIARNKEKKTNSNYNKMTAKDLINRDKEMAEIIAENKLMRAYGFLNREKHKEERMEKIRQDYMTNDEKKEYILEKEAKKSRTKDSGYVNVARDSSTVDRFKKRR